MLMARPRSIQRSGSGIARLSCLPQVDINEPWPGPRYSAQAAALVPSRMPPCSIHGWPSLMMLLPT
jgi:hypothetical protein